MDGNLLGHLHFVFVDPLFSVNHVLSCPKGEFPSPRHSDIRDFTASLRIYSSLFIPDEYPLAMYQDNAHLGVAMNGFWGGQSEKFFLLMSGFLIPM